MRNTMCQTSVSQISGLELYCRHSFFGRGSFIKKFEAGRNPKYENDSILHELYLDKFKAAAVLTT